jgi:hypothetical protein
MLYSIKRKIQFVKSFLSKSKKKKEEAQFNEKFLQDRASDDGVFYEEDKEQV